MGHECGNRGRIRPTVARRVVMPFVAAPVAAALVAPSASAVPAGSPAAEAGPSARAPLAAIAPTLRQPALVTVTSSGRIKLVERDGRYLVRLRGLGTAEAADGAGVARLRSAASLVRRWNRLPTVRRGVVMGTSRSGAARRMWVTFGEMQRRAGGRLVVFVRPVSGTVGSAVRTKAGYALRSVEPPDPGTVALRSGSLTVTGGRSTKWQFSGSAPSASLARQSGSRWTITIAGMSERLAGVQPNGSAAAMTLTDLVGSFPVMRSGTLAPRMVVEGRSQDGRSRSLIFAPREMSLADGVLAISADLTTPVGRGGARAIRRLRTAGLLVETANPGAVASFVVTTGDGYAGGEAARYAGTYLNGNLAPVGTSAPRLPDRALRLERWRLFCQSVDLTCTGTQPGGASLAYRSDPSAVYEDGSWEQAGQGIACHRSRTAAGAWLARQLTAQSGGPVGHVNLACSGAGTGGVTTESFKGQAPQARELAQLARWVPISHVVTMVGAADAGLGDVLSRCATAPARAIGAAGREPDAAGPLAQAGRYADDMDGSVTGPVSVNAVFRATDLCRTDAAAAWQQRTGALTDQIAGTVARLHEAAPRSRVVVGTYPAVVPQPQESSFPRQQWWRWMRPWVLAGSAGSPWAPPERDQLRRWEQRLGLAAGSAGSSFVAAVAAGSASGLAISRQAFSPDNTFGAATGTFGSWADDFFGRWWWLDPLNYGASFFGADQEWLARTATVQLNRSIAAGVAVADPQATWSTVVDTTQLFNGRQPGSTFVGHSDDPVGTVWGDGADSAGAGPAASRASLATTAMPGSADPLLCRRGEVSDDDPGECVGVPQEAWHPNWLGQAALGQCLIAAVSSGLPVVACVRSVGDGTATPRRYPDGDFTDRCRAGAAGCPLAEAPMLFSEVSGADRLCLADPAQVLADQSAGRRTDCLGGGQPFPVADPAWQAGQVTWRGARQHWG